MVRTLGEGRVHGIQAEPILALFQVAQNHHSTFGANQTVVASRPSSLSTCRQQGWPCLGAFFIF